MSGQSQSSDGESEYSRFASLHHDGFAEVLRYCKSRARSVQDADDATADVFLIAWRRLDDATEADQPVAWLIAVARRVISNQYRSRRRAERLTKTLLHSPASAMIEPADAVVSDEELGCVFRTLASLPSLDRHVLVMATVENMSHQEISEELKLSRSAVRTRVYRSRKRLRAALDS